jgi:ATP:ADP antiporter, AAA family
MLLTLGDVRPEERRGVAAAFVTILAILAGHTLLETARDALFLARIPPTRLPFMYIAIAVLAVAGTRLRSRRLAGLPTRTSLAVLLVGAALVNIGLWELTDVRRGRWLLYTLYIWCGLFGTAATVHFYNALSEIYTLTQAKRLYRLIGTGSVLGAILGAGIAGALAAVLPARHLILASSAFLFLAACGPMLLPRALSERASVDDAPAFSLTSAYRLVFGHPYARPLAGLVLSSTMAVTLADYLFKSAVVAYVPGEALGSFFAGVYLLLNALSLVVQVGFVGVILGRLGVHRALMILPLLLSAGATGLLVGGGLLAALGLKTADGALRYSLHRTATELLYLPLPDTIRSRVKAFIDVACQRYGQALASLLILTPVAFISQTAFLILTLVILAAIWVLTAKDLKANYLDLFRSALREGSIATSMEIPDLDLDSLEALFAALNSSDDAEVLGALDLLSQRGKARLIPALILYHPSRAIVLRCFDIFIEAERSDYLPVADRLLNHADPEIRAGALRARLAVDVDIEVLRKARKDPSPRVRAAALVGLVAAGVVSDDAQADLDALTNSQSPEAGVALAHAIRLQPAPAFVGTLLELSEAPEVEVLIEVAQAMASMPDPAFLPALLPMLVRREVRRHARAALLAHDAAALAFLAEALADHALPQEIRRHIPRTISQFKPAAAAPILLEHLAKEPLGSVRFKILRGLGRIHADHPELRIDPTILHAAIRGTLEASYRLIHWQIVLESGAHLAPERATPTHSLLVMMLRDKRAHAVERLFRLLGLLFDQEDLRSIYRGRVRSDPKIRASSRELLENLLDPAIRDAVLALQDDLSDPERLARSGPFHPAIESDYEALLGLLLQEASESLCCLAAHHVAELGLISFRSRLEGLLRSGKGFFATRVLERALALLDDPRRLRHA